jgi:beta-glucanase (GH16 family)
MIERKFCLIILLLFIYGNLFSQLPGEDPNWESTPTILDDFSSFNNNLWYQVPLGGQTWGLETYSTSNVTASGGTLSLNCIQSPCPTCTTGWSYSSGGIQSKNLYSYGYFEIESKQPASGTKGPWGGFWMQTSSPNNDWDEIDILEPNGCMTEAGNQYTSGVSSTNSGSHQGQVFYLTEPYNLSAAFHKYSVSWSPSQVTMYFDGSPRYYQNYQQFVPTLQTMSMFLTFQIDKGGCLPYQYPNGPFPNPLVWQFKHFKFYQLKADCLNGITASNFDFVNHDYKVQKFYNLSSSPIQSTLTKVFLRATDYIQLNPGFSVPSGCEFYAITSLGTCPR